MPIKEMVKKLTPEEFEKVSAFEHKYAHWKLYTQVTLTPEEVKIIQPIYERLDKIKLKATCQDCLIYAFRMVFLAYEATKEPTFIEQAKELVCEVIKKKRKRL